MAADGFPLPRILTALLLSTATTIAIAWLMQSLIRTDTPEIKAIATSLPLQYVRLPKEIVPPPRRKPDPPDPVKPPPKHTIEPITPTAGPGSTPFRFTGRYRPRHLGPTTGIADGDLMPIVAIAPDYPDRAKVRGIEGYVTLQFSVNERGRVENPIVIDAMPTGIFNRAALSAIHRFRYRPRVVNGKALVVHGVMTRLRFQLDE